MCQFQNVKRLCFVLPNSFSGYILKPAILTECNTIINILNELQISVDVNKKGR